MKLNIHVKIVARELAPGIENGVYTIDNGSTIRDLIVLCANQCQASIPDEEKCQLMYPLFNGKPLSLDRVLTGDGTLHICRVVIGG